MKYNANPNMVGDVGKKEDRLRSSAMTKALESKRKSKEIKGHIKAAHKRVKAEGMDFNRV